MSRVQAATRRCRVSIGSSGRGIGASTYLTPVRILRHSPLSRRAPPAGAGSLSLEYCWLKINKFGEALREDSVAMRRESRKKLSRKELVQKDEITNRLEQAVTYVLEHPQPFVWGIAIAVIVAVVATGWTLYASGRNEDAQVALASVIRAYNDTVTFESDEARYQATLGEAAQVTDAYGNLQAGQIARYYAALSHEGLGESGEAIRLLEELVASSDPAVRPIARFALGQSYKKQGQIDQAIGVYEGLLQSGDYAAPPVIFELAQLHEAADRRDQARTYYESLLADYPDSVYQPDAEKAVKRLNTTGP